MEQLVWGGPCSEMYISGVLICAQNETGSFSFCTQGEIEGKAEGQGGMMLESLGISAEKKRGQSTLITAILSVCLDFVLSNSRVPKAFQISILLIDDQIACKGSKLS